MINWKGFGCHGLITILSSHFAGETEENDEEYES
jgi:hypothetical protein